MRKLGIVILISVVMLITTGCQLATKSQIDRLADLTIEVVDENSGLVDTHPRYQVADDMDQDERELTEELKQQKHDRNQAIKDALKAIQGEE